MYIIYDYSIKPYALRHHSGPVAKPSRQLLVYIFDLYIYIKYLPRSPEPFFEWYFA